VSSLAREPVVPMAESKINCPKCGGPIAFPRDLAGQAATCPHCEEPIILGAKPRMLLWTMIGLVFVCAVVGSAMLFWRMGRAKTDSPLRPSTQATKVFEKPEPPNIAEGAVSDDDRAIEALCRAMYDRSNEKDFDALYQLIATPCKVQLTAADLGNSFTSGGASYRFISIESITYLDGPSGKLAKARVRRMAQNNTDEAEGVREFKCIKESDGWKLFRDQEWTQKILSEFVQVGLSDMVQSNVQQFCSSNPFDKWPANVTNAFEKIYGDLYPGTKAVFPWNLNFSVITNHLEGGFLNLGYSILNDSDHDWDNARLTCCQILPRDVSKIGKSPSF
jgi:hypothetical protein